MSMSPPRVAAELGAGRAKKTKITRRDPNRPSRRDVQYHAIGCFKPFEGTELGVIGQLEGSTEPTSMCGYVDFLYSAVNQTRSASG